MPAQSEQKPTTAREALKEISDPLVLRRRQELLGKVTLLEDFRTTIVEPVISQGKDPKSAAALQKQHAEKGIEIFSRLAALSDFPTELNAMLDKHGIADFEVGISSSTFEQKPKEEAAETDQELPEVLICKETKSIFVPTLPEKKRLHVLKDGGNWETLVLFAEKSIAGETVKSSEIRDRVHKAKESFSNASSGSFVGFLRDAFEINPKEPALFVVVQNFGRKGSIYDLKASPRFVNEEEFAEARQAALRPVSKRQDALPLPPPGGLEDKGAGNGQEEIPGWLQANMVADGDKEEFNFEDVRRYTGRNVLSASQALRIREMVRAAGGNADAKYLTFGRDIAIRACVALGRMNLQLAEKIRAGRNKGKGDGAGNNIPRREPPLPPLPSTPPGRIGGELGGNGRAAGEVVLFGPPEREIKINQPVQILRLATLLLNGGLDVYEEKTKEKVPAEDVERLRTIVENLVKQGAVLPESGEKLTSLNVGISLDLGYFDSQAAQIVEQNVNNDDFIFVISFFSPEGVTSSKDLFGTMRARADFKSDHQANGSGGGSQVAPGKVEWQKGEHTLTQYQTGVLADLMLDPEKQWVLGRANIKPSPAQKEEWLEIKGKSGIPRNLLQDTRTARDVAFAREYIELMAKLRIFAANPDVFFAQNGPDIHKLLAQARKLDKSARGQFIGPLIPQVRVGARR